MLLPPPQKRTRCMFVEQKNISALKMFFCFFNSYQIPTVQNISQKQRASTSISGEVLIFCVFLEHVVKLLTIKGAQFGAQPGPQLGPLVVIAPLAVIVPLHRRARTVQSISVFNDKKCILARCIFAKRRASSLSTRQGNIYPNSTRFPFHVRRGSHILRISRTHGQTIDHKGGTQTMMKAF